MGTKHAYLPAVAALALIQFAQALLVLEAALAFKANDRLERSQPRRAAGRSLDLVSVEVRVPAMEEPAVAVLDRNGGMAT